MGVALALPQAHGKRKGLLAGILCGPENLLQIAVLSISRTVNRHIPSPRWLVAIALSNDLFRESHGGCDVIT
jgi:hypothetical protein